MTFESVATNLVIGSGVFIVTYYLLINVGYLLIHILALLELRDNVREAEWTPPYRPFDSPFYPGVAMIVPAYNEAASIVESVRSMITLNYPDQEIVVVNDGSTDATMDRLRQAFDLEAIDTEIPYDVPAEPIRGVYRSRTHEDLLVVDKENGGKSDALNAGLWLTDQKLFCAVDSDTLIDRNALLEVVKPFLEEPDRAVASGGTIRVANNCVVEDGEIQEVNLPKTGVAGIQVMEYLRAFYSGRLGLSRLKGLILISGAFGVFRTDRVREIGGYRHDTITEDFDIVVRLHEYLSDEDIEYRVDFVPEPVAWTEVPDNLRTLGRQRRRWYRGMIETVIASRRMFLRRRYGRVGTVILPFFTAAEAIGPLIEGFGYVLLPIAWYFDLLAVEFFLTFLLLTVGVGIFLSWFGVFSEVWSFNRYERPIDVARLLWYGIIENVGYRQWKTIVAWHGLVEYIRGEDSWGVMERSGFGGGDTETAAPSNSTTAAAAAATATAAARVGSTTPPRDAFEWVDGFEEATADSTADGFVSPVLIDTDGFQWVQWLADDPTADGVRWIARIVASDTPGAFVAVADPTAGVGDGGFVWTTDFSAGSGGGGFVWTTDPTEGVGPGGFVVDMNGADGTVDPAADAAGLPTGRLVATTDFSAGMGAGGFVWTTDPTAGVGDGGFVWTRDFTVGVGDGFVWVPSPATDVDDGGVVWTGEAAEAVDTVDTLGIVWLPSVPVPTDDQTDA